MKSKFPLVIVALLFLQSSFAQITKTADYELIKDNFKLEKKALVAKALKLTPAEEAGFWPLYNAYEDERTKITQRSWDLLEQYANKYSSLTDEESEKMIGTSISVNQDILKLREKYLKSVSKKVSPRVAARFIQLEDYIFTSIRAELMGAIPFIDELDIDEKQ